MREKEAKDMSMGIISPAMKKRKELKVGNLSYEEVENMRKKIRAASYTKV